MGTMYLLVLKVRNGGCIPFFVTERKRSEAALIQVIQQAFVQGVSTRKMDRLAKSLGIENLSRSQVSEMTKGLNEQVQSFRERSLTDEAYPVLWVDALYEKVRCGGRVVSGHPARLRCKRAGSTRSTGGRTHAERIQGYLSAAV